MANDKLTRLKHFQLLAMRCSAMVTSKIAELATSVTEALEEMENAKQDKITSPADIGAASSTHTHNYAGSSSAGGAATSADKLNTNAGSATQPVYFSNGVPVKTTHTLGASVPSGAKFTDSTHFVSVEDRIDIASGTDLNTLTTPGSYRATAVLTVNSLVNLPSSFMDSNLFLDVYKSNDYGNISQRISSMTDAYVAVRVLNGDTWGEWDTSYSEAHKPTASELGVVPNTRKVNGKALSADVTLSASDVGAQDASTAINTGNIGSQSVNYANSAGYANGAGNADTVDGLHAWNLGTLDANGNSHGTSYPMYCKHNVYGDGRFALVIDNHEVRTQIAGYADSAGLAHGTANADPGSATLKNITAGTTDIGAGASLATGQIHFVYE